MEASPAKSVSFPLVVIIGLLTLFSGMLPSVAAYDGLHYSLLVVWNGVLVWLWLQRGADFVVFATVGMLALPKDGIWASWSSWMGTIWMLGVMWKAFLLTRHRQMRLPKSLNYSLILVLSWWGWAMLGATFSPEPVRALTNGLHLGSALLGGLLGGINLSGDEEGRRKWLAVTIAVSLLLIGWSLFHYDTQYKSSSLPFWTDTNVQSGHIALLLPLLGVWLLQRRPSEKTTQIGWQLGAGLALLVFLVALGLFQSRGAWLSLALAGLLLPVFGLRKWSRRMVWLGVLVLSILLGYYFLRGLEAPWNPYHPAAKLKSVVDQRDFSNNERYVRWRCASRMAFDRPILGHGVGRYAPSFKDYLVGDQERSAIAYWFGWRYGAHSDVLTLVAETGVVGLGLLVMALSSLIVTGFGGLRSGEIPRGESLAYLAGILTWLIHGFFADLLTVPAMGAAIMLVLGMWVGRARRVILAVS